MTDKTLTNMANPLFFDGAIVNGLFKWTDVTASVKNEPVILKADGPPIEVGATSAADQIVIGVVLEGGAVQNDFVVVLTKFTGVIAIIAGGTITRGGSVKVNDSKEVVAAVTADVGTAATGLTETRVLGMALQSAVDTDVIYVGICG